MRDSLYTVTMQGHCMGGCVPTGIVAWVDAEAEIKPGTLCSLELAKDAGEAGPWRRVLELGWAHEGNAPEDFPTGFAKLFIRRVDSPEGELFWLGHLDPPAIGVFHRSEIESLHAVVGWANEPAPPISEADKLAFMRIASARQSEPIAPINPDWRPPEGECDRWQR
jgi:hypothetical protein